MNIRLVRQQKLVLPSLAVDGLGRLFWEDVAKVAQGSILDNILSQRQASGEQLKRNKTSTIARKLKAGRKPRSLIDVMHRFIQGAGKSWKVIRLLPNGKGIEIGPATDELKRLMGLVQEKGYVGWIGLNTKAASAIKVLLREEVRRLFRAAQKI